MKNFLSTALVILWLPAILQAQSLADRVEQALANESPDFVGWQELETELDRDLSAPDLELLRFKVLMAAAATVPADAAEHGDAERLWLKKHEGLVNYDEISGRWLVHVDPIWQLFERAKTSPAAEEIAWTAATAPRGGECEGYLPCSVGASLESAGRYLRHFPRGRHAQAAVDDFLYWLQEEGSVSTEDLHPDDLGPLRADLESWRVILGETTLPNRADLLRQLEKLRSALTKKP